MTSTQNQLFFSSRWGRIGLKFTVPARLSHPLPTEKICRSIQLALAVATNDCGTSQRYRYKVSRTVYQEEDSTKQPSLTTSGILSVLIPFRFESLRFALVKSKLKEKPKESSNQHATLLDVTLLYILTSQDTDEILWNWWKNTLIRKNIYFCSVLSSFQDATNISKRFYVFFLKLIAKVRVAAYLRVIWLSKYVLIINLPRVIDCLSLFWGDTR